MSEAFPKCDDCRKILTRVQARPWTTPEGATCFLCSRCRHKRVEFSKVNHAQGCIVVGLKVLFGLIMAFSVVAMISAEELGFSDRACQAWVAVGFIGFIGMRFARK